MLKQLRKATLIIIAAIVGSDAFALSLTVSGTLKTESPDWSFVEDGTPLAYVGDYSVQPMMNSQSLCSLYDGRDALASCVFEWMSAPDGFTEGEYHIQAGAPNAFGAQDFTYQLLYRNGSAADLVPVQSGTHTIIGTSSSPSVITAMEGKWTYRKQPGSALTTFTEYESLIGMLVTVEPRNYRQAIAIEGSTKSRCEIPINAVACLMPISPVDRVDTSGAHQGSATLTIAYGDARDHAYNTTDVSLTWDYRPPVIEQIAVRASTTIDDDEQAITVGPQTFSLNDNEAYVVLSSPHYGSEGDWWLPENMELVATPTVDDDLLNRGYNLSRSIIPQQGDVELVGGEFLVYRFDISNLPDGVYDFSNVAVDKNGNASAPMSITDKFIDRKEPELIALLKDKIFEGGDVFFIQDLSFRAIDGLHPADFTVQSVRFDTIEMMFTGNANEAQRIVSPLVESLTPNTPYTLHVTGIDGDGQTMTLDLSINYMPVDFNLDNRRKGNVEQSIQYVELRIKQTSGDRCELYTDEATAVHYAAYAGRTCYVDWGARPITIDPDPLRPFEEVQGFFDNLGEQHVRYTITMVDADGKTSLAHNGDYSVTVVQPSSPSIILTNGRPVGNDMFALPVDTNGLLAKVRAKAGKGDIDLETTGPDITTINTHYDHTRSLSSYSSLTQSVKLPGGATLWDETEYQSTVSYSLLPSRTATKTFKGIRVPRYDLRVHIDQVSDAELTSSSVPVIATLGAFNRQLGVSEYDASMGDWQVHLAYTDGNGNVVPLSETTPLVNGEASFTLDPSTVQAQRYHAVAELVSPIPEYTRTIKSGDNQIHYIKTDAVDGRLNALEVRGKIPFNVYLSWKGITKLDTEAVGNIDWFTSDDGTNWVPADSVSGKPTSALFRYTEIGDYYVKARSTNKNSGIVSETQVTHIDAYYLPRLTLDHSSNIFPDQEAVVQLFVDRQYPDETLEIQWSTDEGNTWMPHGSAYTVTGAYPGEKIKLSARVRNISNPSKITPWATGSTTIYVREVRGPRVIISAPSVIEKDREYTIRAQARAPYSGMDVTTSGYWLLDDGTQVASTTLDYIPTDEELLRGDVTFTYHSWIDGYEGQSETVTTKTVNAWVYQWPKWYLRAVASPQVVPATIKAKVTASKYSSALTPSYFWNAPLLTLQEETSDGEATFLATTPGVYPIQVVVSDDRGNATTVERFVEVFEADPYEVVLPLRYSNTAHREPADVTVRARVTGGHPDDEIVAYRWYLDGVQSDDDGYYYRVDDLVEGTYRLEMEVETAFGVIERRDVEIEIIDNLLPSCDLRTDRINTGMLVKAVCDDPDGRVSNYNWTIDGEVAGVHSHRVLVQNESSAPIQVSVTVFDDSGEAVNYTIVVNN